MGIDDVLVLNAALVDLRSPDFDFLDKLVGRGGLAKRGIEDMPNFSQAQIHEWTQKGYAAAGGPGNCAPLMVKAGLNVAIGGNLGRGDYKGLDVQGRFFYDKMVDNGVNMDEIFMHPNLPTGIVLIHDMPGDERKGLACFPNANNDFSFKYAMEVVEKLKPEIVYYMYAGLSDRGDANNGQDLADFIKCCRKKGIVTIVDTHTLTGYPEEAIKSGEPVDGYKLLEPMLAEVDIFFASSTEAKMIGTTLDYLLELKDFKVTNPMTDHPYNLSFLNKLRTNNLPDGKRTKLFGLTVSDGAYFTAIDPNGKITYAQKVESRFMAGEAVDLVGAGDAFRAGLLTYIANNLDKFKQGNIRFEEAVQMGNLFASLYIKAPLNDRYNLIGPYGDMLKIVQSGR